MNFVEHYTKDGIFMDDHIVTNNIHQQWDRRHQYFQFVENKLDLKMCVPFPDNFF